MNPKLLQWVESMDLDDLEDLEIRRPNLFVEPQLGAELRRRLYTLRSEREEGKRSSGTFSTITDFTGLISGLNQLTTLLSGIGEGE